MNILAFFIFGSFSCCQFAALVYFAFNCTTQHTTPHHTTPHHHPMKNIYQYRIQSSRGYSFLVSADSSGIVTHSQFTHLLGMTLQGVLDYCNSLTPLHVYHEIERTH